MPEQAAAAERERRERLLDRRGPRRARRASAPSSSWPPTSSSSRRPAAGEDAARARAAGDEVRSVIAGYHWFTDWGRDTMISLEGLTLHDGPPRRGGLHPAHVRPVRARRPHPQHVPRRRATRGSTTRRTRRSGSSTRSTAISRRPATAPRSRLLLPKLAEIVAAPPRGHALRHPRRSRRTGCSSRARTGYQLTWMDAKVGDWVVTPRRGKAVEINALWYNALRLLEGWTREAAGDDAARPLRRPRRAVPRASFNERFWYEEGGYLYDVVDGADGGDDTACRPNQLFAISLDAPGARRGALGRRWSTSSREQLLTPVGLRSLAPGHPDYKPTLRRRSAHARRRVSPGHGLGVADRPVHRRVAQGASRRPRGRAPLPRRLRPAPGRGLRRLDQRGLRRRARRTRRAAASRRRGASPRSCAAGPSPPSRTRRERTSEGRALERRPPAPDVPPRPVRHRRLRPGSPSVRRLPRRRRPDVLADHAPRAPGLRRLALCVDLRVRGQRQPHQPRGAGRGGPPRGIRPPGSARLSFRPGGPGESHRVQARIARARLPTLQGARAGRPGSASRLRPRARARVRVARRLRPVRRPQGRPRWRGLVHVGARARPPRARRPRRGPARPRRPHRGAPVLPVRLPPAMARAQALRQ